MKKILLVGIIIICLILFLLGIFSYLLDTEKQQNKPKIYIEYISYYPHQNDTSTYSFNVSKNNSFTWVSDYSSDILNKSKNGTFDIIFCLKAHRDRYFDYFHNVWALNWFDLRFKSLGFNISNWIVAEKVFVGNNSEWMWVNCYLNNDDIGFLHPDWWNVEIEYEVKYYGL